MSVVLTLGFLAMPSSSFAQKTSLAQAQERYEAMQAKIEAEYSAGTRSAVERYGQSVEALVKRAQSQGDLEALLALMAEKKRFKKEQNIPRGDFDDLHPTLVKLREGFSSAVMEPKRKRASSMPALQTAYLKKLDTMKRELTIDGRLEDALAVKAEMDRVADEAEFEPVSVESTNTRPEFGGGGTDEVNSPFQAEENPFLAESDPSQQKDDPFLKENDPFLQESKPKPARSSTATVKTSADPAVSARQKFLDRQKKLRAKRSSSSRTRSSESLAEGMTQYRETMSAVAEKFSRGESKVVKLSEVKRDLSAFTGDIIRSGVYLVSAFPRGVTVSALSNGKDPVDFIPHSSDVGMDATKLFKDLGRGGMAVVTYGVVSEDNLTLFAIESL